MMERQRPEVVKRLYMRFAMIYGEKFTKNHLTDEYVQMWWDDWATCLAGVELEHIRKAIDHFMVTSEWPPSMAAFRKYCDTAAGLPSLEDAFKLAVQKSFAHPVVHLSWLRVGSWAMSHDKEDVLKKKFTEAYNDTVQEFRKAPVIVDDEINRLASPTPPKQLEAPRKLSEGECKSFRERYAEWNTKALAEMERRKQEDGIVHPEWDVTRYTIGSAAFDPHVYDERRAYLVNTTDEESVTLEHNDRYDRLRYLREDEGTAFLRAVGNEGGKGGAKPQGKEEDGAKRKFKGTKTVFNNWMSD